MKLIEFKLQVNECPVCKNQMMQKDTQSLFPSDRLNQTKQMQEKEIVYQSSRFCVDGEPICIKCAEEGKASFICFLCHERQPSNKMKNKYGDPPDYLCIDCFSSVSAKEWNNAETHLHNIHRYDFE